MIYNFASFALQHSHSDIKYQNIISFVPIIPSYPYACVAKKPLSRVFNSLITVAYFITKPNLSLGLFLKNLSGILIMQ